MGIGDMTEAQATWIENLIDQYPVFENVIRVIAAECAGMDSPNFGDAVLGELEEAGAVV